MTSETSDLLTRPCIEVVVTSERRPFTVVDYDSVQRQNINQPMWARRVPAVEVLTTEPSSPYDVRVTDAAAHNAQMVALLLGQD